MSAARVTLRVFKDKNQEEREKAKVLLTSPSSSQFSLLFTGLFRSKAAAMQLKYMKRFKYIGTYHTLTTLSLSLKD